MILLEIVLIGPQRDTHPDRSVLGGFGQRQAAQGDRLVVRHRKRPGERDIAQHGDIVARGTSHRGLDDGLDGHDARKQGCAVEHVLTEIEVGRSRKHRVCHQLDARNKFERFDAGSAVSAGRRRRRGWLRDREAGRR